MDSIAFLEDEPAQAESTRGADDELGLMKPHEAVDRSRSGRHDFSAKWHVRHRVRDERSSLRKRGNGIAAVELRILENVLRAAVGT